MKTLFTEELINKITLAAAKLINDIHRNSNIEVTKRSYTAQVENVPITVNFKKYQEGLFLTVKYGNMTFINEFSISNLMSSQISIIIKNSLITLVGGFNKPFTIVDFNNSVQNEVISNKIKTGAFIPLETSNDFNLKLPNEVLFSKTNTSLKVTNKEKLVFSLDLDKESNFFITQEMTNQAIAIAIQLVGNTVLPAKSVNLEETTSVHNGVLYLIKEDETVEPYFGYTEMTNTFHSSIYPQQTRLWCANNNQQLNHNKGLSGHF